jgi:hypothetical protein
VRPDQDIENIGFWHLDSDVTVKGFISFAATKTTSSSQGLHAAKLMKPLSELNRE